MMLALLLLLFPADPWKEFILLFEENLFPNPNSFVSEAMFPLLPPPSPILELLLNQFIEEDDESSASYEKQAAKVDFIAGPI